MSFLNSPPGLDHWLILSTLLFAIGMYGVLTRRNAVGILIALELALNSAALNFVVFNSLISPAKVDGSIMAIFIIAVAAAEVVVAMAIFVALYRHRRSMDVTGMNQLKDR
jgi:NAD(P)H-quinone oxidoreductase subunit 4L